MQYKLVNYENGDNDLEKIFFRHGLKSKEDILNYLNPTESSMYDPLLLDNICTGANMLIKHIKNNSKIFILPDCDLDGFTSAAILWNYIKKINPNQPMFFKVHEGKQHGIEDSMMEEDVDLFIIPDAGTNQYQEQRTLIDSGYDVLIIDHHLPDEELEDTGAIIVNNQTSKNYPNKTLCGAAMALKFCLFCDDILGVDYAKDFFDLAAIGLIGDMMYLNNIETHYIVSKGLSNIKNYGIKTLIDKQAYTIKDTSKITPMTIAFYIAPLVNALIRVGRFNEKENLFLALVNGEEQVQSTKRGSKEGDYESRASQNARYCVNARTRQNKAKEKIIDQLEYKISKYNLYDDKILFLEAESSMDPNLTGLVANHFANKYKKPTIVARFCDDGTMKGSGRGYDKSNIKDFREFLHNSGYFDFASGHANSFGMCIKDEKVPDFINYVNKTLENSNCNEGTYEVDFVYDSTDPRLLDSIVLIGQMSEIWGKGMEEPYYVVENIRINTKDINIIGSNSDTIKFSYNGIEYIKFKDVNFIESFKNNTDYRLNVIGKASLNEWGGDVTPQIIIEDFEMRDINYEF